MRQSHQTMLTAQSCSIRIKTLGAFALLAATLGAPLAHAEGPSWYKRKKAVQEEKKQEAEAKAAEKPAIGPGSGTTNGPPPVSTLSQPDSAPPVTQRLFHSDAMSESISLDFGTLKQPVINGTASSLSYSMGWWWTPRMTLGVTARATGVFRLTHAFMLVQLGPQLRWFFHRRWNLTTFVGFGVSRGLSRVEQSHIPGPPDTVALRARQGLGIGAQFTHLFWTTRKFSFGPSIGYWRGNQSDRTWSTVTFGLTYQSGRPDYAGSMIDDWQRF